MKVFVSSVISEFEELREAANVGIRTLGHEVLRAEDFSASNQTAQQACLGAVRASDVVVLILGQRYGSLQASGLSPTHEEYQEARGSKPVLVFVQQGIEPDQKQSAFIEEVQQWASGHTTRSFGSPQDLSDGVIKALHDHELTTASGQVDPQEMQDRARELLQSTFPDHRYGNPSEPLIELAVTGGPLQQILRPAEVEDVQLAQDLQQMGLFGAFPVLDSSLGTKIDVQGDILLLMQESSVVAVNQSGSILVRSPISGRDMTCSPFGLPTIIEEEVAERVTSAIGFCADVLDRVDPSHRISRVVPQCRITSSGSASWTTRAEQQKSPNTAMMRLGQQDTIVGLSPPSVPRQSLRHEKEVLAEDLVTLLRREANR